MRIHLKRGGIVFFAAVFFFFLAVGLCIGLFVWRGRPFATVELSGRYYFLVRDCESATAGAIAGESYFSGGAGYLLEEEDAVALACYYSEADAAFVEGTMSAKGVEVRVLEREAKPFSVSGKCAENAARIRDNAATVDSLARLLFDTANNLERVAVTQEEARAALTGVVQGLSGLASDNGEGVFSLWNLELRRAARKGKELREGILFAKDLRYLQIQLLLSVLSLPEYFS